MFSKNTNVAMGHRSSIGVFGEQSHGASPHLSVESSQLLRYCLAVSEQSPMIFILCCLRIVLLESF